MANNNRINFDVDFNINRQQIQQLQKDLQALQNMSIAQFSSNNRNADLNSIQQQLKAVKQSAAELEGVFNKAFNSYLGELNLHRLNEELNKINPARLQQINQDLKSAGEIGTRAFSSMASQIMQTNLHLRQGHKLLDNMAVTLGNTIKWTITSSAVNRVGDAIQSAWNFTKGLDTDLNDIRIVTSKSADEMERFARQANKAAQSLGAATRDYTQASLIFYQQGLSDEEVNARTSVTLKAANVTGQQASEVSEQLTAVWNGYRVSAAETEAYVDKLAAVGANTASNLEELSTAMSKVASAANTAGVPIDNLNAILSTVISVTREAPETIGTAFKTIFARLGDLSLGGTDEEGIGLGNVSTKLHNLGVEVLDQQGQMREMGDIIEDVAAKWQTWTRAQQQAAAVAMAGKMQYSRLISLFENWDMYTDALNTSQNALGTLQEQQNVYMESTEAHLQKLQTAWDRVSNAMVNNKGINSLIDGLTNVVNVFGNFVEAIGGGSSALLLLGSIVTQVFNKQITASINTSINNLTAEKKNIDEIQQKIQALKTLMAERTQAGFLVSGIQERINELEKLKQNIRGLKTESIDSITTAIEHFGKLGDNIDILTQKINRARSFMEATFKDTGAQSTRQNYITNGTTNSQGLQSAIVSNKAELEQSEKSIARLREEMTKYNINTDRGRASTRQFTDVQTQMQAVVKKAINDWTLYGSVSQSSKEALEQFKRLESETFNNYYNNSQRAEKLRQKFLMFLQTYESTLKEVKAEYQNLDDIIANGGANRLMTNAREQHSGAQDALQDEWNEQSTQKMIQSFVSLASAVTSVTFALQSLSNIGNILNNEDLSAGEKVLQVTMALGTALSTVGFAILQFKQVIPDFKNGLQQLSIHMRTLAFATLNQGQAATATAISNMTLAQTIKGLWLSLGPIGPLILGITTAMIALGTTVAIVEYNMNKESRAAEESAEKTKKLKEIYQETKQVADNFKSTLNDYKSAIDNIKTLTVGTEEYKTAIIEANEKAIDLLKTNKDLAKYAYTDEKGIISFTNEGIQEIIKQQNERVYQTQLNYLNGEINTLQKQLDASWKKFTQTEKYGAKTISNNQSRADLFNEAYKSDYYYRGNVDLNNRPIYQQDDGSISTVRSGSFYSDKEQKYISVPGIYKVEDLEKAIDISKLKHVKDGVVDLFEEYGEETWDILEQVYNTTGQYLSKYDNLTDSIISDTKIHEQQELKYENRNTQYNGQISRDIIEGIARYMRQNNYSDLARSQLGEIEEFATASSNVQEAIKKNIDAYVEMANKINESTKTQELYSEQMTKSYLQMKGIIDDDGKMSVKEIIATKIVEQQGGVNISDTEYKQWRDNHSSMGLWNRYYNTDEIRAAVEAYEKSTGLKIKQQKGMFSNFNLFEGGWRQQSQGSYTVNTVDTNNGNEVKGEITVDELMRLYGENQIRDSRTNEAYIKRQQAQRENILSNTTAQLGIHSVYQNQLQKFLADSIKGEADEVSISTNANTYMSQAGAKEIVANLAKLDEKAKQELLESALNYTGDLTEEAEKQLIQTLEARANTSDAEAFADVFKNGAAHSRQVVSDLTSGSLTKENANDNKALQGLLSDVDSLLTLYPELTNEVTILNKTALVGSEAWAAALHNVKQRLDALNMERLNNDLKKAQDSLRLWIEEAEQQREFNIDFKFNNKDFMNYLDELLNANYAIDIEIHAQAENAFNTFANTMEQMEKMASKIGDDYLVAASDLRALNAVFPDIWDNMKITEEGTIKLNETSVKLAIQSAEENLKKSAEQTLGILENQKTELNAQKAKYQAILQTAQLAQKGEIDSREAASQIQKQLKEVELKNNEIATNTELENAKLVADDSNVNAKQTAINWDESAKSAAGSMIAFGQQALQTFAAIASNGAIKLPSGWQNKVSYNGAGGKTNSDAKVAELNDALDNIAGTSGWDKVIAQTQAAIALVDNQINDINGMIVETGARLVSGGKTLNNVSRGLGSDGKKSGGSSKDPDQMDYLEDEKDFYHDINLELKKYETELARLEGQQEKLFGQDLIENYNKQLETLNKTIDATNRKIEIARGEMKLVGDYLSQRGVMFDADGYISNYTQIYEDKLRATNGIIDAYNKMSAEEQENYKDAVEAAKKDFDEFVENINRYDEIVSDLIPGLIDDIQEAQDKQIEISISKFNMAIELELDTAKLEKDWAKFQRRILKNITDKQFGYVVNKAKDILETEFKIFYDENNSGIVQNLTQQVLDTQRELEQIRAEGWSEIYGDNEAQALEDLKNYHSQLMEQMEDYQDKIDEVRGSFKELMDEAAGRIEEQLDLYEQLRGLINHDINIIKMVYGEDSYSALTPYYEQIEEQYTKELKFRKQQKELYEAEMESAEKHFTKESEEWRTARKNYIDALDAWKEASEQAVQATIDTYVNKIDDIFQTLEMKVTNNLGLDYVSEEWELINKSSDMYLDNLNAMYEVQKLAAKYQDAFDRTDSLSAQKAIRELQESELKDLRERDKLTKYDIERANLKYELMLKQIALEEAQQNKSSLRLRRDSQGNYTYQYVADDDAVKKAEQELGDVYNELYNLDRNRYKDNLDQAYAIYEEFHQKMRDLAANTTMDTEEKERWKALYVEQYGQMINDLLGENELIRQNLRESALAHHMYIMDTDKETFEQMTDAETQDLINKFIDTANPNSILSTHGQAFATVTDLQGKMEEHFKAMDQNMVNDAMTVLAPGWDSAVQAMIDTFTREGKSSNEKAFDAMVKNALEASKTEFDLFGEKVHQISKNSTTDFETLKNEGLDPVIESSKDLVSETDNVVTQYKNLHEVLAGSGGVLDQLGNLETRYKSATDAAKAAADAAHAYTIELQNQMAQEAEAERQRQAIAKAQITQNTKTVSRDSTPSSTTNPSSSKDNSGGSGDKNGGSPNGTTSSPTATLPTSNTNAQQTARVGSTVIVNGGATYLRGTNGNLGEDLTMKVSNGSFKVAKIDTAHSPWTYLLQNPRSKQDIGWFKLNSLTIQKYRSGGYTGDWANDNGKLAILHKKELVLNASDTENILAAVDAIRSITLGQLSPRQSMMADIAAAAQSMEQNVHIDATFPNVHDASEIEAALNNLTNRASQYANRKENY